MLAGRLGPAAIIFMIIGAAAPLTTVSATVPVALLAGNGPAFPSMYVIAAIILAFFAVGFTAMTPFVTRAGAFYAYVTKGLGRGAGLASAFLALFSYTAMLVAVHAFMGVVLQDFVISIDGPSLPWWIYSIVSVAVVGALGYRNIDLSGKLLGVVLVAEVGICFVFSIVVTAKGGGPEGLSTAAFRPAEIFSGSPALALMFAISGFIGFEAAAIYRDEARDPDRTIPRAIYGSLAIIGAFYAFTAWSIVNAWGERGALERASQDSATMFLDAASNFLGVFGEQVMQYLLIGSVFAAALSFHNVISRYIFSLSNTNALPAIGGLSHPRHESPHSASLIQTISSLAILAICAIAGLDPIAEIFTWLVGIATLGVITLMFIACIAIVMFFRREHSDTRVWNTRIAPVIGCAGLGLATVITVWNLPLLMESEDLAVIVFVLLCITVGGGFLVAHLRPNANSSNTMNDDGDQSTAV